MANLNNESAEERQNRLHDLHVNARQYIEEALDAFKVLRKLIKALKKFETLKALEEAFDTLDALKEALEATEEAKVFTAAEVFEVAKVPINSKKLAKKITGKIKENKIALRTGIALLHQLADKYEYPEAMGSLGDFYEQGFGVKQDSKMAEKYYSLAEKSREATSPPIPERTRRRIEYPSSAPDRFKRITDGQFTGGYVVTTRTP